MVGVFDRGRRKGKCHTPMRSTKRAVHYESAWLVACELQLLDYRRSHVVPTPDRSAPRDRGTIPGILQATHDGVRESRCIEKRHEEAIAAMANDFRVAAAVCRHHRQPARQRFRDGV